MDSVLRGWVIGHLVGEALSRRRDAQQRWCAIAYSDLTGMAWAYNHRSARAAEHAALVHCQGPRTRLWACGAEITIAVARGPRGAFACQGADPRLPTHAATGSLARCQASYPPDDPDRNHVWLALVLDARHGVMYPPLIRDRSDPGEINRASVPVVSKALCGDVDLDLGRAASVS